MQNGPYGMAVWAVATRRDVFVKLCQSRYGCVYKQSVVLPNSNSPNLNHRAPSVSDG